MTRLLLQLQDAEAKEIFKPIAIVSIDRLGCFHFELADGTRSPVLSAVHACYLLGQAAMGWTHKLTPESPAALGRVVYAHEPYVMQNAGTLTGCKYCHLDQTYWGGVPACPGR